MTQELLTLFRNEGALLSGHFQLSSGRHGDRYLQCALILQKPPLAETLGRSLAGRFQTQKIDVVIGPALGGILVSYEVARALGVRSIFAERENGVLTLRRQFQIREGEKALVVEDVVTTGKSTQEVIDLVRRHQGVVVGVGALVDRSGGEAQFGVPLEALLQLNLETYDPKECLLCQKGAPVLKPGSRPSPVSPG